MTEITNTFDEEEISKLSIGEKIQKGYYEVIDEEEWQKDMQTKYGNMSEKCERLQKQLDIAVKALRGVYVWANTGNGGEQAVKKLCNEAIKQIRELNK